MKQKILLVDDKEENLMTLDAILSEIGDIEIFHASNGNDALKSTLHHDFSLSLLDIQMPGMDGYELAELLRGGEKTRQIPIIFVSGIYTDDFHVFKGYETGAVDFVTKPFNPDILLSKIRVYLELHKQREQLKDMLKEQAVELAVSQEELQVEVEKQVEIEEKFHDSAVQWQNTFDMIDDYIMVVDKNFRIVRANWAFRKAFGPNIANKYCYELLHGTDHIPHCCNACKTFDDGLTNKYELCEPFLDNRWFEIHTTPIKDDYGKIEKIIHWIHEITGQKEAEAEKEMLEKRLRQSEKMEAVGRLAGGIAHDFNNQITPILGYAQILEKKLKDNPDLAKHAEIITSAAQRSTELVKQLLTISRKEKAEFAAVDIHQVINEVFNLLQRSISKSIELHLHI